jgi:signal transduction histidine kinase
VAALREPRTALPLAESLHALAAETSAAGVPTELTVAGPVRALTIEADESLYRAAQEGLTNVRKHARATRAHLVLDYCTSETVRLEIRDDGTGSAEEAGGRPGFGLLGLRERVSRLGGQVTVDSTSGRGLTLFVELPG